MFTVLTPSLNIKLTTHQLSGLINSTASSHISLWLNAQGVLAVDSMSIVCVDLIDVWASVWSDVASKRFRRDERGKHFIVIGQSSSPL